MSEHRPTTAPPKPEPRQPYVPAGTVEAGPQTLERIVIESREAERTLRDRFCRARVVTSDDLHSRSR